MKANTVTDSAFISALRARREKRDSAILDSEDFTLAFEEEEGREADAVEGLGLDAPQSADTGDGWEASEMFA
jgi:hypothetical protein